MTDTKANTLIVEYDPILGDHEPDALIHGYVIRMIHTFLNETEGTLHRVVANELMIMEVRVAIKQKRLNHEQVIFRFKGQDIHAHSNGRLPNWPKGFCDTYEKLLTDFLDF